MPEINQELLKKRKRVTKRVRPYDLPTPTIKQPDIKLVANREQTGSKTSSKLVANREQTGSKTSSKLVAKPTHEKKPVAQPVAKGIANWEQTGSKLVANQSFFQLTGLQKKLVETIYFFCRKNRTNTSPPITIQHLSEDLKSSSGTIKNALHRLMAKGFVFKHSYKNGRGGWTQYRLGDSVYSELFDFETSSKLVANREQTSSKPVAQPVANSPSSSSYNIITTTTDTDEKSTLLSVRIPQSVKAVGFNASHLRQLEKMDGIAAEDVRESLEHFAHDLERNNLRIRTNPVALLMGIFRKGGKYTSADYAGELERETDAQLAEMEKREKGRREKRERMEELLFTEWLEERTDEELKEISPSFTGAVRGA